MQPTEAISFSDSHPTIALILYLIVIAYALTAGAIFLPTIRNPQLKKRQEMEKRVVWSGNSLSDIQGKQRLDRLKFEFAIFGAACIIGALGGWIYVVMKRNSLKQSAS